MATFVTSNIPAASVDAQITNTGSFWAGGTSWTADTIKVALYGTTPDSALAKNDTLAHNAYLAVGGQWVTANESTGTNYVAGGTALVTPAHSFGSGTVQLTGANPSWTTATLTAVFGCLVYDSTLTTKYAFCWNYFGGSQSVTAGTFTVVWSGSGILQYTIT
jgi:hypothetical protein